MQMNSGLGTFGVLPVDLRYLIWEHLSPSSGPFLARSDLKQDLSILQILKASRKLREEVLSYLFDGLTLTFVISPGLSRQDLDILVHDQRGSRASISDWTDVLNELTAGFDQALLFERLRAIRIEIAAPRPDDPGELLQIWNNYLTCGSPLEWCMSSLPRDLRGRKRLEAVDYQRNSTPKCSITGCL